MRIRLTCRENDKYDREIDVQSLNFNPQTRKFQMYYCMGDYWDQEMECRLAVCPITFTFEAGHATIRFERQDEADAFAVWLIEGEAKEQEGYQTMRG